MISKAELRKIIRAHLAALTQEQFTASGLQAARRLPEIPRWNKYPSVLAFCSMKDEIDTRPVMETILNAGKALFIPRVEENEIRFYRIGKNDLENFATAGPLAFEFRAEDFPAMVITPGLAFDRRLLRLGRGRGCYDRFFARLDAAKRDYTAVGLCMECQLVDEVPVDPWDKKLDMLLTERSTVFFR